MGLWNDIVRRGTTGEVRKEDDQKDEIGEWMLEYLMGDEELKKQHVSMTGYVLLYKAVENGRKRLSETPLEGLGLKEMKIAVDRRGEVITAMFRDMEKGEFDVNKDYRTPLWNQEVRDIRKDIEKYRGRGDLQEYIKGCEKLLEYYEGGYKHDLRAISKLCK